MRNKIKIKAVVLGGVIFFTAILLAQNTAAGIPVSLSYQVTSTSESTENFNASMNALFFRDEHGDWHSVPAGDNRDGSQATEININSVDKIRLRIGDVSIGSGRLETAVTLPSEDIEIPVELNLKPYQKIKIHVGIFSSDSLQESGDGTYLYNPHLLLKINGSKMGQKQADLLLKTEINQSRGGVVKYGSPAEAAVANETATGTEVMQAE